MLKKSLLPPICVLLLAALAQAQPTLQSNVVPNVGDFVSLASADTNAVQPGNPGANLTWNFAALSPQSPPTISQYIVPTGTPYAASFTTANLVTKVGGGDTAIYSYARKEAGQFLILGTGSPDFLQTYSNPDAQLKYPTNYNGTYQDDYAYTTDAGTGFPFYSTGTHAVKYDAYGTLTTPLGTFPNTMRIRATTVQTDSANIIGNEYINYHNYVTYDWLAANQPGALVSITYFNITSIVRIPGFDTIVTVNPPFKTINYISAGSVSAFERPAAPEGLHALSVGPNPATDQLTLRFTADRDAALQIRLTDAGGRLLRTQALDATTGDNSATLFVADLPPGAYFLTLTDGRGLQTTPWQKF